MKYSKSLIIGTIVLIFFSCASTVTTDQNFDFDVLFDRINSSTEDQITYTSSSHPFLTIEVPIRKIKAGKINKAGQSWGQIPVYLRIDPEAGLEGYAEGSITFFNNELSSGFADLTINTPEISSSTHGLRAKIETDFSEILAAAGVDGNIVLDRQSHLMKNESYEKLPFVRFKSTKSPEVFLDVPVELMNSEAPIQPGMENPPVYFYLDSEHQGWCNANLLITSSDQYEGNGIVYLWPKPGEQSAASFSVSIVKDESKTAVKEIEVQRHSIRNTNIGPISADWAVFMDEDNPSTTNLSIQRNRIPANGRYYANTPQDLCYLIINSELQGWANGRVYTEIKQNEITSLAGEFYFIGNNPPTDEIYRFLYGPESSFLMEEFSGKISYQPVEEDPQLFKLLKNPARGYNYDAYIRIPENWDLTNKHLLVTPNNTAIWDNRISIHDQKTYNAVRYGWEGRVAQKLGVPALFPVFPNPDRNPVVFPHALTRASILIEDGMMERLDRQLVNMINDARILISEETGNDVEEKILLTGFSASGHFAHRFSMLYPELVKACVTGGTQQTIMLPLPSYNNIDLPYPIGVADMEELIGHPFNIAAWQKTAQYIYRGDQDIQDPTKSAGLFQGHEADRVRSSTGEDLEFRWQNTIEVYRELAPNAQIVTYEGLGHNIVLKDIVKFLEQNSGDHFIPIVPKKNAEVHLPESPDIKQ